MQARSVLILVLIIQTFLSNYSRAQDIVTYVAPEGVQASKDYEVLVRTEGDDKWKPVFVHTATVNVRNAKKNGESSFASFDASYAKPVEIKISKKNGSFKDVKIRPESKNIKFTSAKQSVQFKINKSEKLSVEFDGDRLNNLFIFSNNIETDVPGKDDANVVFYGPGIHQVGDLKVKNGQIIYLQGGAVVQGSINIYDKNNVTIRGRGILNGSVLNHDRKKTRPNLLKFKNGNNIKVEGITLIDSPVWSLFIDKCEDVKIDNVKVISYMINADGITLSQSKNVTVNDVFIRSADDNISIKSMNGGSCEAISVTNATLWADDAHNMLIGPESKGANYAQIKFSDIDVLENTQRSGMYSGVMSIMASDKASISGIYWDKIRIGDISGGELIRLNYTKVHSVDKDSYGNDIRDIHFSNITYNGANASAGTIKGVDGAKTIRNVTIKNFRFNNEPVKRGEASAVPNKASSRSRALRPEERPASQISVNSFVDKINISE